ncbi:MAG: DUF342 domain-containing protein [Selenomonadaceae bacterium]|nr:DUF342 domain-containing protein [Selenomonadaceae bacterium]
MDESAYPTCGGPESGFLFEFKPEGVYLTIYPDAEVGSQFEITDLQQVLKDAGIDDYDLALLMQAVKEADGEPTKITGAINVRAIMERLGAETENVSADGQEATAAEKTPDNSAEEYARIIVEVSRDRQTVTIKYATDKGFKLPTAEMVLAAMADRGIIYGIDRAAVDEGVKSLDPFVAAQGDPPVHGENAYIERRFNLGEKGRPVANEYDKVDFKDLNLFVLAKENDTLAIRIPQTKGTAGKDVFGSVVPARDGRPVPMPAGKNTKVIGENQLIATANGQIVDTGSKISIDPRLEIKGDVGVKTGNIDFDGRIDISGNVEMGFTVKATGDISIGGGVNGAEVRGRNVVIKGGITGADRGRIFATENVQANFIENAVVEAGIDVIINDVILHSNVTAGKKIIVDEKRGFIIGGSVAAGELIRAKIIGNQAYVATRLSVGVDPALQTEYRALCKSQEEGTRRLQQITQTLNTLGKIDISRLPQERINQINALTRSQFPLAGQLKRGEKRKAELEQIMADMKNGRIKFADTLYPGVTVSISGITRAIQKELKRSSLTAKGDKIIVGPY